jgi:hypothetical protein
MVPGSGSFAPTPPQTKTKDIEFPFVAAPFCAFDYTC